MIACLDRNFSNMFDTPQKVKAYADYTASIAPFYGRTSFYQGAAQCYGYPLKPVSPPPLSSPVPAPGAGQAAPLVVSATHDASTPLVWAARAQNQMSGSRLLIRNGDGHINYTKSTCIQQKVDRYLVDLMQPANGTVCATDNFPDQPPIVLGPPANP